TLDLEIKGGTALTSLAVLRPDESLASMSEEYFQADWSKFRPPPLPADLLPAISAGEASHERNSFSPWQRFELSLTGHFQNSPGQSFFPEVAWSPALRL